MNFMLTVKLPIKLHRNQELINNSPARYVVVKSGKRFGKTELALYKLIKWAFERPGGTFWYLTDTAKHAEEIGWKRLIALFPKHLIKNQNNNKLQITTVQDSTIKMMGCEDPNALRGTKLHGVVLEEAAYIRNGKEDIWDNILFGQLAGIGDEEDGSAFFISSPNKTGANWFSKFFDDALHKKEIGDKKWDAYKFTIYDNPLYKPETIQAIKDSCTEDTWEVEYMANESAHAGQIISEFNRSIHLQDFENPKDAFLSRGIDWGIDHPTGCLWLYTDLHARMVYVSDEYKKSGKGIDESCGTIKLITGQRKVEWSVLGRDLFKRDKFNPARLEASEFFKHGIPVIPSDTRSVGYDVMKMFFKKNMIKVHPKCRGLIQEIESVQWGDKVGEDLLDCLRYSLLRINNIYFGGNLVPKEGVEEKSKNPFEFNLNSPLFQRKPDPRDLSFAYCADDYEEAV